MIKQALTIANGINVEDLILPLEPSDITVGRFLQTLRLMTDPRQWRLNVILMASTRGYAMSHGQSRLYDHGAVAEQGDVAAGSVMSGKFSVADLDGMQNEIQTLRSINAHLVRQVATLRQREAHAQRLADRDGLTGLFNRRKMMDLVYRSVDDAMQQKHRVGLLFIDLDGFKAVNDACGHAVGDKLLVTVGARIAARARTGDFVCRYGGDEFVVVLPRVADVAAAKQVADSIRKRVALPYRIDGHDLQITAAVGLSIFPDQAPSADALMQRADESMYRSKSQSPDMQHRTPAPTRRRDDNSQRHASD